MGQMESMPNLCDGNMKNSNFRGRNTARISIKVGSPFNVNNVKYCVDMFPKTTGIDTGHLIYLETGRSMWRA